MTSMTTIYRIEDERGDGPFRSTKQDVSDAIDTLELDLSVHVAIHEDLGFRPGYMPFRYSCGCESPEQLRDWFDRNDFLNMLDEHGFMVKVYTIDTDEVSFGFSGKQVAFDRMDATLVASYPASHLTKL